MPNEYLPRRLPRNREYPGYQFYCVLTKRDADAGGCFCFAALCVIDWLKQRLRETKAVPPQIARLPERQKSAGIGPGDLESFTISSGFSAYVVSLPKHGIWTLRLKEPDSDTDGRKADPERFFATNVGLRVMDETRVEMGIRIDVIEPEGSGGIEFAFRPKLVRYLYEAPDMTLTQAAELPYRKAIAVENQEQLELLKKVLDSGEAAMPVILVTQGVRVSREGSAPLFGVSPLSAGRPAPPAGLFPAALPVPELETYYPFDADGVASHNFGYAITFRVAETMHRQLAKRLKKDYTPGDILFAEPKRFGGQARVIGGDGRDADGEDAAKQVWRRAHRYSKDRRYSFGNVLFEFDARDIERREQTEATRASTRLESKMADMNRTIDEQQAEIEKRGRKIDELREQNRSEFERGEKEEKRRTEQLRGDYDRLCEDLRALKARVQKLEWENREARAFRSAAEAFRDLGEMPRTNEDVVDYFGRVFADRIGFTERGAKTARKCDVKPEALWYYLYRMATTLHDIHHDGKPDVEGEFRRLTGIEAAMGEGSCSHRDNAIMALRKDVFEGKEVWVEPHVKLNAQRAGADHRRIYYCYDRELDRIIIGWVGDHMRTYGTQFAD